MAGEVELKSAHHWAAEKGDTILDPDGWRFSFRHIKSMGDEPVEYNPISFDTPITEQEYVIRRGMSTTMCINRPLAYDPEHVLGPLTPPLMAKKYGWPKEET